MISPSTAFGRDLRVLVNQFSFSEAKVKSWEGGKGEQVGAKRTPSQTRQHLGKEDKDEEVGIEKLQVKSRPLSTPRFRPPPPPSSPFAGRARSTVRQPKFRR
jgi:hypothetical protein